MVEDKKSSQISGFYKKSIEERVEFIKSYSELTDEETKLFSSILDLEIADRMVENVLGTFDLPLGVALNFKINGKDYIIPMATEESSVIAASSNAAKIARIHGGFTTECSQPLMIGQMQLLKMDDVVGAAQKIMDHKKELL